MLPFGTHIVAALINGILLAVACLTADRLWGPEWRVLVVGVVAFLPAFFVSHLIAMPLFSFGCRLTRWHSRET